MSLADAKAHLSAVVNGVHDTHERVVITRNGRPAAVLISPDDLAALEETLDVLSDSAALERIAQARRKLAAGEGLDEQALARFLADT